MLVLVLVLGLAAMRAASDAEAAAEEEVWDDDGETGEPDDPGGDVGNVDGEPDPEGDAIGELNCEAEPAGEGEPGVWLGRLLGLVVAAGEVEEPEGEGDGVGVGDFDGSGV